MSDAFEQLEPVLAADEIQGNILGGFNKDHQAVIPLRFAGDAAAVASVRGWLAEFLTRMTWLREVVDYKRASRAASQVGRTPVHPVALWRNLAFSFPGLRKLTPEAEGFTDNEFRDGMSAAASARLGDPGRPGDPGHIDSWVVGRPGEVPDVLVIVAGDDPDQVTSEAEAVIVSARAAGMTVLAYDIGHDLGYYDSGVQRYPSGHEHFGYKDNISQPGIRGRMSATVDDFLTVRTVPAPTNPTEPDSGERGQFLVCAGEFVLGYSRQNQTFPRRPLPPAKLGPSPFAPDPDAVGPAWAINGSFLVYRRLRQDVPAFNRFLAEKAADLAQRPGFAGVTSDALGALIVGRWKSGAPVMRAPHADVAALGASSPANNDFGYAKDSDPGDGFGPIKADPLAMVCPASSHTRKVNPRDLATDQGSPGRTLVHRLLRRGIPFGPPLPPGATEDPHGNERGLLFLSYQTSIREQFEFLVSTWMNDRAKPSPFGPATGLGFDMLVGQNPQAGDRARFCVLRSGSGDVTVSNAGQPSGPDWVLPTGGGYFFAPSRSAIRDFLAARVTLA